MADRTVTVSLVAQVNGYISGMQKAAAETRNMGSEAEKLAQKKEAFNQIGIGALALGAALAGGLGLAVKAAADFDAQMAQVQTLSHATSTEMGALREAALNLGQGIGFSATEVADAETELTKAGVSVTDQLKGGLKGALDLAAAGQLNVADATSIAASAMTQFKLKGSDVPHIADLLAAGADKALGSVQDLGEAMKYVGPVSQSLGVSIEQTTGTLALFAQNGILGEQAGTSLRGVLLSLTAPSQAASDVMEQYGINLFNAQGNFIGVNGAAQQLKDKLSPLDQATRTAALGQIFGNQQITAANVLYEGGAKSVDKWTKAVDDNGFAAEQASGKMDSLKGDLSKLKAAFETDLIETGESANTSLRGVVQGVTGVVQAFGGISDTGKSVVFVVGAVAAGTLLLGGAFLTVVPKIAATKIALAELNLTSKSTGVAVGALSGGIAAATIVFSLYAAKQAAIASNSATFEATLNAATGAVTKNTRASVAKALADKQVFDTAKDAGISQRELTDAVLEGGSALEKVQAKLGEKNTFAGVFTGASEAAGFTQLRIKDVAEAVDRSKQSFKDQAKAGTESSDATSAAGAAADGTAGSMGSLADASADAAQQVQDVSDALKGLTSPTLDARAAFRDYEAAIDAVTNSIKDNGTSLDDNTDKGRSNEAALDSIASSAQSYASALYTQTGNQDQATAALEQGRASLITALGQYGITGQAAEDYADKILGTPTQWATTFQNNAAQSQAPVESLKTSIQRLPATYQSDINVNVSGAPNVDATTAAVNRLKAAIQQAASVGASTPIVAHAGGPSVPFADGGAVYGPGTATSDSVSARLSTGEHVLTARDVSLLGGQAGVYAFRASLASGVRKFAEGGAVTPTYVPAPPQVVYAQSAQSSAASRKNTYNLYSLDPEPYAQAVIRRENLGFV